MNGERGRHESNRLCWVKKLMKYENWPGPTCNPITICLGQFESWFVASWEINKPYSDGWILLLSSIVSCQPEIFPCTVPMLLALLGFLRVIKKEKLRRFIVEWQLLIGLLLVDLRALWENYNMTGKKRKARRLVTEDETQDLKATHWKAKIQTKLLYCGLCVM